MDASDLADEAWGGEGGDGDKPMAKDAGNPELEAYMAKLGRALKSGDFAAAAKAFSGAMEACG